MQAFLNSLAALLDPTCPIVGQSAKRLKNKTSRRWLRPGSRTPTYRSRDHGSCYR